MVTHSSILAWRNPMDRGTWWATAHGVAKESDTTEQLKQQYYYIQYITIGYISEVCSGFLPFVIHFRFCSRLPNSCFTYLYSYS